MNEPKGLLTRLGETLDQYRAERRAVVQKPMPVERRSWLRWLGQQMIPNIGTLLMVVVLLLTIPSLAAPLVAPSATSTSTISYQGRLADSGGTPLTGVYNLEFRIYDVPTGGVPLWTELWTGASAVNISDGLFNVMLGSIDNTLAASIDGYDELYLGITVDTDSEMIPRVQLGSVPFSMQAMTVVDGSITTDKIADAAVTQAKLGADVNFIPPAGSITTTMIADGAVTSAKLNIDNGLAVNGAITLTGTLNGPTSYWVDYRSYIRFLSQDGVNSADLCPEGGVPVGVIAPKQSLEWATGNDICQHNYQPNESTCVNVHKVVPCGSIMGNFYPYPAATCSEDFSGEWAPFHWGNAEAYSDLSSGILRGGIGCYNLHYACCTSP